MPRGSALERADVSDAILDAVEALLARYGYKKMTSDDVAAEAGIGKGTVYLHFESKEDVVLSYVDRLVTRVCGRLQEIAGEEGSAADRLRRMLVERVMLRFDRVKHYPRSLAELLADVREGLLERRRRHFASEIEILSRVLREGRRGGELSFGKAEETAEALVLATNALLPFSLSPREVGSRAAVEKKAGLVAEILVRGLLARSAR
jgi:AcrR family transcriptional regulator